MAWKITVLCENTVVSPGFVGEHGFSAYLETPEGNFLFDTGQGFSLLNNAQRLRKDLSRISQVVLSHGHFDHTGGLVGLLGAAAPCDVVAHPDVFSERFWMTRVGLEERPLSVGMPWPEAYLTSRGARFRWITSFTELARDVYVTGEVPRRSPFEKDAPNFVIRNGGEWVPDPFLDDYSLIVRTSKGLVIVLGCAHAGLINILDHAVEQTGESRIHAVLGGTHLGFLPPEHLEHTISALRKYRVAILAVSHCTGQAPVARLASEFGGGFAFGHVGFVLQVDS